MILYYLITIGVTLFWFSVGGALAYATYFIIWKPSVAERKAKEERLRRYYDRRG